jgi:hypothetical protein
MKRREFFASTVAGFLPAKSPPNLLFIMTDQMRFDAMSCAGNSALPTPNLDRLAREGVRFEDSICPFPVCVPSRTGMLTGKSSANSGVPGNNAAKDTVSDPGLSFDNILHGRGYKSQYYRKWHAPYKMARTYDNKVAAVNVPGLPNEHQGFLTYLDQHVPRRAPRKGELVENYYGRRPYRPYPVDSEYQNAQAGIADGKHPSQQAVIGVLDVPKEYTHAAYAVDRTIRALEEMKDGPFALMCSIDPPHPPAASSKRLYRKCRSTLRLGCTPPGHFRYSPNVFRDLSGKNHPALTELFEDAVVGDGAAGHGSGFIFLSTAAYRGSERNGSGKPSRLFMDWVVRLVLLHGHSRRLDLCVRA